MTWMSSSSATARRYPSRHGECDRARRAAGGDRDLELLLALERAADGGRELRRELGGLAGAQLQRRGAELQPAAREAGLQRGGRWREDAAGAQRALLEVDLRGLLALGCDERELPEGRQLDAGRRRRWRRGDIDG